MNKIKKALRLKDPSTPYSSFYHEGIEVIIKVPADSKEKNLWLIQFLKDGKQVHRAVMKRAKGMDKLYVDKEILRDLDNFVTKHLNELLEVLNK